MREFPDTWRRVRHLPGAEDGATIKHFSRNGGRVRLLPANKEYEPISFGPDGRILGKVVTVLRRV